MSRSDSDSAALRLQMIETQIVARGISDPLVLSAMGQVPRELFLPGVSLADCYADRALPIATPTVPCRLTVPKPLVSRIWWR